MNEIIKAIRADLQKQSSLRVKESNERFFKEAILHYGLRSAQTRKISQTYFMQIKSQRKEDIFQLIEELFQSGYMEECIIAALWTEKLTKAYLPSDIIIFERWVNNYITNWATCDTFCCNPVGNLITMYPQQITYLKQWAKTDNMWLRRAAAVSLVNPAKKGLFLPDVFEIADTLLMDKEDLVQKGYGWMLKVAANKYEKEVFDYVVSKKATMPRTALRYAIEKMPQELRKIAMAK